MADVRHLWRIIWINRLMTFVGYATAWLIPNPLSAYCISQGIFGRWMVMHHVGHGGYDRVPGLPAHFHSKRFAMGWRRFRDWFDWIDPEAWNYEHNVLHHYYTSEHKDPDLVEDHAAFIRASRLPMPLKYLFVAFMSVTWKFTYYAPNTLRALDEKGRNEPVHNPFKLVWDNALNPASPRVRRLWLRCYLPYVVVAFVLIPLLFLPLGWWAVACVLINRILAEMLTNFHSFLVVAPNHSGEDLYRFPRHFHGRHEYCLFQVVSSCNYRCGSIPVDYLHGYLNYQIEHHLYPKIPMQAYHKVQPQIKALCHAYDVPYVQEGVWTRLWRMTQIMVGARSMRWHESPPPHETAATKAGPSARDVDAVVDMESLEDSHDGTLALER